MKQIVTCLTFAILAAAPLLNADVRGDKKPMPEFGKPFNGLVASVEATEHKPPRERPYVALDFTLKNTTDKSITICDYVGSMPLQVKWIGPDGKTIESDHYGWLRAADIMPLGAKNFVTIPAGGTRRIGPEGGKSAIVFHTVKDKDQQFGNVAGPGKHRITVSYVNKEDGKNFKLNNVWTGTVTAPEVTFTVK